ncbi:hypothetical protein OsI_25749 [Oryza sativa Indica Group]|uniref:Uncharacterized protein n=1 Tax=Oryza sativa subsp. indica TaxID=39946 RepID=A2YKK0_ORYSI|nr:hypothetical protein OsI_25749 [Oryza sativa Indica Group]
MTAASLVGEAGGLAVLLTPRGGGRRGRRLDVAPNAGVGLEGVEKRPAATRIWPAVEEAVAASVETGEEASAAEAGRCGRREDGGGDGEVEKRRRQGARWRRGGGGEGEVERRRAARIWGCRRRGEVFGGADPRGRRILRSGGGMGRRRGGGGEGEEKRSKGGGGLDLAGGDRRR